MKKLTIITLCLLVGACSDRVSGEYGGDGCAYSKMDFRGNGIVYITISGSEYPAFYKIDGNKLIFEAGGQAAIFQIDGDTIDGGNIIGRCRKLDHGGIISSLLDNEDTESSEKEKDIEALERLKSMTSPFSGKDKKQQKFNKKDQQEMDRLFETLSKE